MNGLKLLMLLGASRPLPKQITLEMGEQLGPPLLALSILVGLLSLTRWGREMIGLIQNVGMLDARVMMHHGTGGDDLSDQLHVLDCEPSFEALEPLLKDPKRLLNQTVGLTECPVVALAVIGQIGEVGSFEPWLQCLRG